MAEYWKSTPKYWCKHCSTFVKDTKLERTNHEATGRHQGNLQRFLRNLHKTNEREVREKQAAKDEVERLNGTVKKPTTGTEAKQTAIASSASVKQATPADRKRQLQQLAEMGIAVPEDFRREVALAGDWQTTSRRFIHDAAPKTESGIKQDAEDAKPALNIGVRKRKHEGEEDEDNAGEPVIKKGWGSTTKAYPGAEDDDLDALLGKAKGPTERTAHTSTPKGDPDRSDPAIDATTRAKDQSPPAISSEDGPPTSIIAPPTREDINPLLAAESSKDSSVVFKKRKPKVSSSK